jgi:ferredoxin-NADP reductase
MTGSAHDYHPLVIADVIVETSDSRSFVLEIPEDLTETFTYRAGQFCTFRADIDGESVVRSYSMSSSPDVGDPFTTTVKRVPEGRMSNWMIDTLKPGDTIEVMRPAGLFVLRSSYAPIVAFAGGSGITPVISIIKTALKKTSRDIVLVYANRTKDSVIFAEKIEQLSAKSGGRLIVHHHIDEDSGFLDPDGCAALVGDRSNGDFYVCGPGPYMDTVEAGLAKLGVTDRQLFIERFLVPSAPAGPVEPTATESLVVRIDRRKREFAYHQGDTILEAVRREGLKPPFSCESGSCGTCMALVESGTVTMRVNNALTADEVEEGWVLTCQSIPTSREVVVNYDA